MKEFLEKKTEKENCQFSPWFMKMYNNGLLYEWWDCAISEKLKDVGSEDGTPVRDLWFDLIENLKFNILHLI